MITSHLLLSTQDNNFYAFMLLLTHNDERERKREREREMLVGDELRNELMHKSKIVFFFFS